MTARSLAQHTEHYTQNLESMLSKRFEAAEAEQRSNSAGVDEFPKFPAGEDHADGFPTFSTIPSAAPPGATDAEAQANTGMQVAAASSPSDENRVTKRRVDPDRADEQFPVAPKARAQVPPAAAPSSDARPAAAKSAAKPPTAATSTNELLQALATRVKDDPRDAVAHLNYQLLQFLLDEQVPELQSIAPLPAEDRELLTTLLDGLTNFRNGLRGDANSLQSQKVAPLLELADRLRSQGDLTLSTAALCKSVKRFGVYEPMEPPRFIAGSKGNEAVLYCEVANFSSQLNDRKLWETKFKQEAVLYSETGLAVWSDKSDTVVDQSRNRLHDFFIADKVRLPSTLPVGRYLMKMTVTDLHANRVAEATVPIQIVTQTDG